MNQFDRFAGQAKYGDVEKARKMVQQVPISKAPFSIDNVPRRLQKQEARGGKSARQKPQQQQPQETPMPPVESTPPYPKYLAGTLAEIASIPGASDLVKFYAQKANEQAAQIV